MPYFAKVGRFSGNKGGVGARGYHIFRRGRRVRVVWGPVDTYRGRTVRLEWNRTTMHRDYWCGSTVAAVRKLRELIAKRESEGYDRLPSGARIVRLMVAARSVARH